MRTPFSEQLAFTWIYDRLYLNILEYLFTWIYDMCRNMTGLQSTLVRNMIAYFVKATFFNHTVYLDLITKQFSERQWNPKMLAPPSALARKCESWLFSNPSFSWNFQRPNLSLCVNEGQKWRFESTFKIHTHVDHCVNRTLVCRISFELCTLCVQQQLYTIQRWLVGL